MYPGKIPSKGMRQDEACLKDQTPKAGSEDSSVSQFIQWLLNIFSVCFFHLNVPEQCGQN